jgi:hypothetical protein
MNLFAKPLPRLVAALRQPGCRQLAHIEQLRRENAALKERIEQMEWER